MRDMKTTRPRRHRQRRSDASTLTAAARRACRPSLPRARREQLWCDRCRGGEGWFSSRVNRRRALLAPNGATTF